LSHQHPPGGPPGPPYGPPGGTPPPYGQPPVPYVPPGGGYPQGQGPIEVKNPRAITERNPVVVVLLSMVTCGIYYLLWLYWTDSELKEALGDEEIKPAQDVLLTIVTCFLWAIYVEYRNAQKIYRALSSRYPQTKNQSEMVLIMNIAALFVGATWIVATYILQEELNKLANL
jgi:hypothetical protein